MEAPAGWRAATRRGAALPRKALPAAREAEEETAKDIVATVCSCGACAAK